MPDDPIVPPVETPPKSPDLVRESAEFSRKLATLEKEMKAKNESQDSINKAFGEQFDLFKTKMGVAPTPPPTPTPTPSWWGFFEIPGL